MPPHGAEEEPEAGHRQPGHCEADQDDQRVIEAGPLRIIHVVEHPEEVPPAPTVIAALQQLAGPPRHIVAAALIVGEIDLPDG